jgi:hypothetical protein
MQTTTDILSESAKDREKDIALYQINIDNYRAALADIEANHKDDPDMATFADQLRGLLKSSIIEQRKEQIMLNAIKTNLGRKDV